MVNFEQSVESSNRNEQRELLVRRYLIESKTPYRLVDVGDIITTTDGPYFSKGLLVIEKKPNGFIIASENPDSNVVVELRADHVRNYDDYAEAMEKVLGEMPLSDEEVHVRNSMKARIQKIPSKTQLH